MTARGPRTSAEHIAKLADRARRGEDAQRLLRDLALKGYSWKEIGAATGLSPATLRCMASKGLIGAASAAKLCAWYDEGCAALPDKPARHPAVAEYLRRNAEHARKSVGVRKDTP